jgi:hypothetical protein
MINALLSVLVMGVVVLALIVTVGAALSWARRLWR